MARLCRRHISIFERDSLCHIAVVELLVVSWPGRCDRTTTLRRDGFAWGGERVIVEEDDRRGRWPGDLHCATSPQPSHTLERQLPKIFLLLLNDSTPSFAPQEARNGGRGLQAFVRDNLLRPPSFRQDGAPANGHRKSRHSRRTVIFPPSLADRTRPPRIHKASK